MKKVIGGLVAVGALFALRSAAGRGGQKMRDHCERMAGKCKQMMAGQSGEHSEMREHCKEMMASHGAKGEETSTPERSEQESPRFVANGEAVTA